MIKTSIYQSDATYICYKEPSLNIYFPSKHNLCYIDYLYNRERNQPVPYTTNTEENITEHTTVNKLYTDHSQYRNKKECITTEHTTVIKLYTERS
jgi:hypothetical protein